MKSKKGISLIVLVITIIVMIILSAAIILSLNNAGVIGNANKAVSETDYKSVQTAAQLVYADMMLSETEKPTMMLKQGEYIKQKLISQGTITADQAAMYRFKNNGDVVKLQTKAEYEAMYANEKGKAGVIVIPYGTTTYDICSETDPTKIIMPDTLKSISMICVGKGKALEEVVPSKNLEHTLLNIDNSSWYDSAADDNGLIILEGVLVNGKQAKGDVIIPNTVQYITTWAFDCNQNITSITIPNTVEKIGAGAFGACSNLENVKFLGKLPVIESAAFGGTNLPEDIKGDILTSYPDAFNSPDE